jgi:hypothetical protein
MIIFLLLNAGCVNTQLDNFCLWANPIMITKMENEKLLSENTLRQIDNYNQEFEERCQK